MNVDREELSLRSAESVAVAFSRFWVTAELIEHQGGLACITGREEPPIRDALLLSQYAPHPGRR